MQPTESHIETTPYQCGPEDQGPEYVLHRLIKRIRGNQQLFLAHTKVVIALALHNKIADTVLFNHHTLRLPSRACGAMRGNG